MKTEIQAEKAFKEAKDTCPECNHPLPPNKRLMGNCFGCLLKKFNIIPKEKPRNR